jgi:hypothetical protein
LEDFLFFPQKTENKGEGRLMRCGKMRKGIEMEIEGGESANKNLGGDKRKNANKNNGNVGNSNCAVFDVLSGYACNCR